MKAEELALIIMSKIGKSIGETGLLYSKDLKEGRPLEHYREIVDNLRVAGVKTIECAFMLSNMGKMEDETKAELERVAGLTEGKTS